MTIYSLHAPQTDPLRIYSEHIRKKHCQNSVGKKMTVNKSTVKILRIETVGTLY